MARNWVFYQKVATLFSKNFGKGIDKINWNANNSVASQTWQNTLVPAISIRDQERQSWVSWISSRPTILPKSRRTCAWRIAALSYRRSAVHLSYCKCTNEIVHSHTPLWAMQHLARSLGTMSTGEFPPQPLQFCSSLSAARANHVPTEAAQLMHYTASGFASETGGTWMNWTAACWTLIVIFQPLNRVGPRPQIYWYIGMWWKT